jgi:hypothetical protein
MFRSTLSSATFQASSTIKASSFSGYYSADGSLLTQVGEYTSSILTSNATAARVRVHDISANLFQGLYAQSRDSILVNRKTFLSTTNIYIAAGNDSLSNGNIQTSGNAQDWTRALDTNFEYNGNDVTGNSNLLNPLYVAAGADSRTLYTLQWSQNGRAWNPAVTGGFSYTTGSGIREATSVVYNSNLSQWVALGKDVGGSNTIQYSSDGSNWSLATGGFQDYGTKVKVSPNGYVAIGNGTRFSFSGISWFTGSSPILTAIAYGTLSQGPFSQTGWLGAASNVLYYSITDGNSWQSLGVSLPYAVADLHYASNTWVAVGFNQISRSGGGFTWSNASTLFGADVSFKSII